MPFLGSAILEAFALGRGARLPALTLQRKCSSLTSSSVPPLESGTT